MVTLTHELTYAQNMIAATLNVDYWLIIGTNWVRHLGFVSHKWERINAWPEQVCIKVRNVINMETEGGAYLPVFTGD